MKFYDKKWEYFLPDTATEEDKVNPEGKFIQKSNNFG